MHLSALTPAERLRRRRRSRRPLAFQVLLFAAVAAVAVWHWWPGGDASQAAHASGSSVRAAQLASAQQAAGAARVAAAARAAAAAKAQQQTAAKLIVVRGQPKARLVPELTSRSAILIDGHTGQVIFWMNPHARVPIASVTKIMTGLLAIEHLKPTTIVTVDPLATRVPPSKEGLLPHEQVPAWKLLYASLLFSGNDSALALGIAVSGTREGFLKLMNSRAAELGMKDTHFNSASGVVDVDNYSSAWDMAALSRVAMQNPRFRAIVGTREKRVTWAAPIYSKIYTNHNRLLTSYAGADGIKTGWTTAARHTLVASAHRGKTWLIGVTLGSADSFTDMKRLLDLGFKLRGT